MTKVAPAGEGRAHSDWLASDFSGKEFRKAVGAFPTGVTVITTEGDDQQPYGMTANAFSSVSLDPPLVLVCVISGTEGHSRIEENGVFAVNVLSAEQAPISRHFASRDRPRGKASFDGVPHRRVATRSPVLEGVAAYLDCRRAAVHEAGDHVIFIGEVLALGIDPSAASLLYHAGQYGRVGGT